MSGKIITISQPRYLPACNYLHRAILSDVFVYLDTVQYSPRDWENRNRIKTSAGILWLSVPVIHKSRNQIIKDTYIDNSQHWQKKHLRTIQMAYTDAPYFDLYFPFFEKMYMQDWERLIDLNSYFMNYACKVLDIECTFMNASELNSKCKGQELLINICNKLGADVYLSGSLGVNYIKSQMWDKAGKSLFFHEYNYPEYPQLYGEFVPWLSLVDMLMNCGPNSRQFIESKNISQSGLLKKQLSN